MPKGQKLPAKMIAGMKKCRNEHSRTRDGRRCSFSAKERAHSKTHLVWINSLQKIRLGAAGSQKDDEG